MYRVTNLMLAATSEWGPRPYTLKCVMAKMGTSLYNAVMFVNLNGL